MHALLRCKRIRYLVLLCGIWGLLGMLILVGLTAVQQEGRDTVVEVSTEDFLANTPRVDKDVMKCANENLNPKSEVRDRYLILTNFIRADKQFGCFESVTYTTHGEVDFLSNLVPLCELWNGPISISVYASGTDFDLSVRSILYLRQCFRPCVRDYVTFHLFFDTDYSPESVPTTDDLVERELSINCSAQPAPWIRVRELFRFRNSLLYPINVARNTARLASTTYFVLASDIELYPSANIIPEFLQMVKRDNLFLQNTVFVLPIFEVKPKIHFPTDKTELLRMLTDKSAIPFHEAICSYCHRIPNMTEWQHLPISDDLKVFHVSKRQKQFEKWEPIYIGTNEDPLYDERLSWEGIEDKMTQGYIMCLLDYNFSILNNAFLTHRPGIKTPKRSYVRWRQARRQRELISSVIAQEIKDKYGENEKCVL